MPENGFERPGNVCELSLLTLLFGAPVDEVAGVEGDAEKIGGDETELGGADPNDANDGTVDTGDDPALPELLADEHGSEDGQNAGEIIESNDVEHVQHVLMSASSRFPPA